MRKLLFLVVCIYINIVYAAPTKNEDRVYLNELNSCKVTKPFLNDYEPEKFQLTNNLLRSTGDQPIYCGQKIIVKGRLLDINCVPIADAKIYLWQIGCDGKYPYKALRKNIDKSAFNLTNASTFQGSGIATTNNLGEFYFLTILPPSQKQEGSNVNVRVEHRTLGTLQTKLHFSSDKLNLEQEDVNQLLGDIMEDAPIYNFEIVMPKQSLKNY